MVCQSMRDKRIQTNQQIKCLRIMESNNSNKFYLTSKIIKLNYIPFDLIKQVNLNKQIINIKSFKPLKIITLCIHPMLNFPRTFLRPFTLLQTTKPYSFSSTAFAGYTQRIYQKLSITRLPHETFTVYLDTNDTVSTLLQHLESMYPSRQFIVTNKFLNKVGAPVTDEDVKLSEEIKKLEVVELLMHSNLMVYEKDNNTHNLCIGVEIKEYHETNNRNLPEHITSNILQLAETWRTDRSVQFALSKTQNYNEVQHSEYLKQKQQLLEEAKESYQNYLALRKFYNTKFFENGKARSLMANLIALMSVNWVALFGITYGAYGWDVGEPLSYLTVLAVELIAMMGIFSANQVVERTGKEDWRNIATRMNLESLLRTREYLIAHSKRHF